MSTGMMEFFIVGAIIGYFLGPVLFDRWEDWRRRRWRKKHGQGEAWFKAALNDDITRAAEREFQKSLGSDWEVGRIPKA